MCFSRGVKKKVTKRKSYSDKSNKNKLVGRHDRSEARQIDTRQNKIK